MIFQNSLIKSLIHKIQKIKLSRIFWQVKIDGIESKMSKIIKKIEKYIVNCKILKKKYFTCQYFRIQKISQLKNFLEFFDKIYNPYNKAPQKCLEFFTSLDRWNRKKRLPNC